MNFGNWIVVAFVFFALFIGTLVTVCVREDINLVSKDYYKDELAYQDQIKRISNTQTLHDKPEIKKINSATFKVNFKQAIDHGEINFFCPSDQTMDKRFTIKLSEQNSQLFDVSELKKGMYRAKLLWSKNGKEFFLEEVIYI